MSHPSRVCGLKFQCLTFDLVLTIVAPFAGVWIEIFINVFNPLILIVAPFAGVWIEIRIMY